MNQEGGKSMSQLSKPRIAIAMKKEALNSFLRIEAEFCGCDAEICSVPPKNPLLYDLILIDPEVGYCISDGSGCWVIAMVDGYTKKNLTWAHEIWEWPISVETVRNAYEQVKLRQVVKPVERETVTAAEHGTVLYLISREEGKVLYRNQMLTFTPNEMTVLCALADACGQAVSEDTLREQIGGGKGNHVAVHICNVRRRLHGVSPQRLIETRRNEGYALCVPLKPLE